MQKELINGGTSFKLVRVIAKMLENEKVSDDWLLVSKYYSVRPKRGKIIYLAYDSESVVAEEKGPQEIDHFEKVWNPDIIIVFGEMSYQWYKKMGYETYLMGLGYDDLNYKRHESERKKDLGFVGSIDRIRWSNFYHRNFIASSLLKTRFKDNNAINMKITNKVDYKDINRFFSECLIGLNDLIYPSPNMRCYEIPSNGAFMLTNDLIRAKVNIQRPKKLNIKPIPYPLTEGKHYMIYEDFIDLLKKIEFLMENRDKTIKQGEKARKIIMKYPLSKSVRRFVDKCGLR